MHSAYSTRLSLYFGALLSACILAMFALWWYGLPWTEEGGAVAQRQFEVQQQLEMRSDFLRSLLKQGLDRRRSEVRALVQNDALSQALSSRSPSAPPQAAQNILEQWINAHPNDFQSVRIVRADNGTVLASTNPHELSTLFGDANLLQPARRPGVVELIVPHTSPTGKPALAWVRQVPAVHSEGSKAPAGLVVAHAEVQDMLEGIFEFATAQAAGNGQTLLFDAQQRLLASVPARNDSMDGLRIDSEVSQGFEGSLVRTLANGDGYLTVYRTVALGGTHHWTLMQLTPMTDIHAVAGARLIRSIGFLVASGLFIGFVLWLTARLATRRLLDVSAAFDRLAGGELALRLPIRPHDNLEIVTLSNAFNRLAMSFQASNKRLEQQVAERTAELENERDRAKGYLDVAGIMLLALDAQGRISMVNRKGAELLGYPAAQLLGMDWFLHFIASEQREQRRSQFQQAMHDALAPESRTESPIVDARGQTRLMVWNTVLLRDRDGRPNGLLSSGQDVTATRAAQAELRVAAIAFESQEPHMVCDANWVILRVNSAFSQVTGYSAQEAVGQMPSKLLGSGRMPASFYVDMNEALLRMSRWQGEVWDRRKNGEVFPAWLQVTAVRDEDQHVTHFVVSMNDITQRKAAEEQIRSLAFYDPLTSLPNRRLLMDRLEVALATCARHPRMGALLFVDLDNFKTLNDTMGHDIGDLLLQQVAERLKGCVREGDTVARLGGDEFVVMLEDLASDTIEAATQAESVGEKVLQALGRSYVLRGHTHRSTPSIGVTLFGDRMESIEEPLKRADVAMYQSKAAGRNTLRFFDPQMQAAVTNRVALEADLRSAIELQQMVLFYQPQVQSRADGSLRIVGCEALVRWRHPQRGMVSPVDFIPLAEETGLIVPLGQWVIETACRQLAAWEGHPDFGHLTVAVNVSAKQFMQSGFVSHVRQTLESTGAHPARLKIELTESTLVGDIDEVARKMSELQSWGVGFALDDFGTGYSSLAYLKRLPLDALKIDKSFVRGVFDDANDAAIARMVVVLGRSLGLTVIAEGVETLEQRYFLAQQGCHVYQGYLFSPPQPVLEFQHGVISKAYLGHSAS
ncbi:EAL domain-containing protein [Curvibacter sp. APW13]|uniref:EAL domain-containing protein n=1 Tax=Curvibacter sp. APW13 TaxID=3077236 RepID=UPI0028DE7A44|nr:EAL domain-containing protein [Curvibacter sp. APW13]MDT8990258.1 EAL domain-containing protein [Curvibacter sp. APW13]